MDMASFKKMYNEISKKYGGVSARILNGAGKETFIEGILRDAIGEDMVVIGDDYIAVSDIFGLRPPSGAAKAEETDRKIPPSALEVPPETAPKAESVTTNSPASAERPAEPEEAFNS